MPTNQLYDSSCATAPLPPCTSWMSDLPWWLVTPVQALVAQLPTGRAPRPSPSRRKSPLGGSKAHGGRWALSTGRPKTSALLNFQDAPCRSSSLAENGTGAAILVPPKRGSSPSQSEINCPGSLGASGWWRVPLARLRANPCLNARRCYSGACPAQDASACDHPKNLGTFA